MASRIPISPKIFNIISNVDVERLLKLSELEIRPILPCLVRMSLCAPTDSSSVWKLDRKRLLQLLSGLDAVNGLVALLSVEFNTLEIDARKEKQLRLKIGSSATESILISQLEHSLALDFEKSEPSRRLRLVLSELMFVMAQIQEPKADFYHKVSELFESEVYLNEVADVISIAQAELPNLLLMTEVSEALLHVTNGGWMLCRLVANTPDTFTDVCYSLVSKGEKHDEDSVGGRRRMQAIKALCDMNPSQTLLVRQLCVEHCRMSGLAVALTLEMDRKSCDIVPFVMGLLLGNDQSTRIWFAQFIRNGQKRKQNPASSVLYSLRQRLLEEVIAVLPDVEEGRCLLEENVIDASALIRAYCSMKGIASMRFNDEEIEVLLNLITIHPPPTAAGVRFVTLGLCMLLACPYMIGNIEQEKQVIKWIKWLVEQESHFVQLSGVDASFGEMLLLVAIHFHNNHPHAIADLVCSTLGMKSAVKTNTLAKMKVIFTQEIFTEQVVTAHAIQVPVTKALNSNIQGYLPVHCIYQLLKGRVFSKHKVPIKDWIYKQLCECSTPIHPLIPSLIEAYVTSIITPNVKTEHTNQGITEQEILDIFKDSVLIHRQKVPHTDDSMEIEAACQSNNNFTTQLLLMYYVLLYQDTRLSNIKSIVSSSYKIASYSSNLLAKLPFRYLLHQAQKQQKLYAGLFSPLLRLLMTHYPHLCVTEDWLEEDMLSQCDLSVPMMKSHSITADSLSEAFARAHTSPASILLHMESLLSLSPSDLAAYADIITSNLSNLLHPDVPRKVLDVVKKIWIKLNTIMPREMRSMTVNALRDNTAGTITSIPYTEDNLTLDPLTVLRCHNRVFRCPPLLEICLRILWAYIQASRTYLSLHSQFNPVGVNQSMTDSEREELQNALVAAQESACVQILLEVCLPMPEEKDESRLLSNLREVQCLVCSHVHQTFIYDPTLAKLVHFQGYPSELIPITVSNIPSMHICLDFIPELLSQPQMEKQIFAIQLASQLCLQYALPKALGVAKLVINVMSTLLTVLSHETRPDFYLPILSSTVSICQAFPPLHDDVNSFLMRLGKICSSHMSTLDSVCLPDIHQQSPTVNKYSKAKEDISLRNKYYDLSCELHRTFADIVKFGISRKD